MTTTTAPHTVLAAGEGLRLQSGPGRDLIFKVTGEDTGGALTTSPSKSRRKAGHPCMCTTGRKRRFMS